MEDFFIDLEKSTLDILMSKTTMETKQGNDGKKIKKELTIENKAKQPNKKNYKKKGEIIPAEDNDKYFYIYLNKLNNIKSKKVSRTIENLIISLQQAIDTI